MSPLIRTVKDLRTTVTGLVALVMALAPAVALIILVIRGVQKDDLAEWGIVLGLYLAGAQNLLTAAERVANRATDPVIPTSSRTHTTTTIEAEGEG